MKTTDKNTQTKQPVKKPKKFKKLRHNWTATVVEKAPTKNQLAEKAKKEAELIRIQTFASIKTLWKPYALLIAHYFSEAYSRNFDYLYDKLNKLNSKAKLSQEDMIQMQIIVSLNKLKYYIHEDDRDNTINVNLELIERDFFQQAFDKKAYDELIQESDQEFHYSISFLIKTYNLLISFVKEKQLRQILYKAIVIDNKSKEKKQRRKTPLVLTEALMDIMPIHDYLCTDFKKREAYKYDANKN